MEAAPDIDLIGEMYLREITEVGGEQMLYQRLEHDVRTANWTDEHKELVLAAAQQAMDVYHHGDTRDDQSYATHVLRVACRIVSPNHFSIRHDYRLIIAAILHDVIENRPERLLGEEPVVGNNVSDNELLRTRALDAIATTYDSTCADFVRRISNPIYDRNGVSTDIRHAIYSAHINDLFDTDTPARYIKLSDFIDNCLGLEYNPDPLLRLKLSRKYMPLLPRMVEFVLASDIEQSQQESINSELFYAHELCKRIITSNGTMKQLGSVASRQHQIDIQVREWRKNNHFNNSAQTTL